MIRMIRIVGIWLQHLRVSIKLSLIYLFAQLNPFQISSFTHESSLWSFKPAARSHLWEQFVCSGKCSCVCRDKLFVNLNRRPRQSIPERWLHAIHYMLETLLRRAFPYNFLSLSCMSSSQTKLVGAHREMLISSYSFKAFSLHICCVLCAYLISEILIGAFALLSRIIVGGGAVYVVNLLHMWNSHNNNDQLIHVHLSHITSLYSHPPRFKIISRWRLAAVRWKITHGGGIVRVVRAVWNGL